ncbi:IS1595 family transposase [Asticcacaulis solisilvae]|uniref:IS1595 family transposase n=1 Tax=Asticcacaulis solisilvae TaxID=1217274 RepID=UPI003FD879B5
MSSPETLSLYEFFNRFPDEEAARKFFEGKRWADGVHCPHCGSVSVAEVKNQKPMPYRCRDCRQHFSVRTGTVLGDSRLPLHKWLMAIYMMTTARKGIPSTQVARELGITQKSAWFLCQRIRETWLAQAGDHDADMGPTVEVDETFVGGKETNKHASKKLKKGRGAVGKAVVVGVKARTGEVRAAHVQGTDKATLHGFISAHVQPGSLVCTDEHAAYRGLTNYDHMTVRHSAGEYVNNMAHTNGIESFWSLLKRGYYGVYHYMSVKHLNRYVGEFANRQNTLKFSTLQFMGATAERMIGRHISYKELINA